jgi:signal recognition particle GTPase
MSLTTTETLGFADAVIQFMNSNQATLLAAGLDVSTYITGLTTQKTDAVTKNDQQEALKAQLRVKTEETSSALETLYSNTSTKLDAVVGVLGKTTELGKQAARIRSDIRRGPNTPAEPPPTP